MAVTTTPSFVTLALAVAVVLLPSIIAADEPAVVDACESVFDVVQIQDLSPSFAHLWPKVSAQTKDVVTALSHVHADARFGFAAFSDKNIPGLHQTTNEGNATTNYCLRVELPVRLRSPESASEFFEVYKATTASTAEPHWSGNAFGALYRSLLTSRLNWRRSKPTLVVLVTNTVPHVGNDPSLLTKKHLPPFGVDAIVAVATMPDENYACNTVDYPRLEQLVKMVKRLGVQIAVLAAPCGTYNSDGGFVPCPELAKLNEKYWGPGGLSVWYRDQFSNGDLENVLVYEVDNEAAVYTDVFKNAMAQFKGLRCMKQNQK